MRARFTLFQALLGLLTSLFGWPSGGAETPEDQPWGEVSRSLEGVNDPGFIRRTLNEKIPGFLDQVERDSKLPRLLALWGLSRNIDESHLNDRAKTVPPGLLRFFNSILKVPYDPAFEVGHAGLTHTYGYLFSTLETPYGFKRARYVRGEIESGFGLPKGLLGGRTPKGSLLLNLTLLTGPIAFRKSPDALKSLTALKHRGGKEVPEALTKFDFSRLQPKTLMESTRIGEAQVEFQTDVVPFLTLPAAGGNAALLVHSIRITRSGKSDHRLITAFPVGASFGAALFDPKTLGDLVPLKLRYNAMLPSDLHAESLTGKRFILQ